MWRGGERAERERGIMGVTGERESEREPSWQAVKNM